MWNSRGKSLLIVDGLSAAVLLVGLMGSVGKAGTDRPAASRASEDQAAEISGILDRVEGALHDLEEASSETGLDRAAQQELAKRGSTHLLDANQILGQLDLAFGLQAHVAQDEAGWLAVHLNQAGRLETAALIVGDL